MKSIADYQHRAFAADARDEIRYALRNMMVIREELQRASEAEVKKYAITGPLSIEGFGSRPDLRGTTSAQYSQFSSFAWVNRFGKQVIRASMTEGKPPLLDVSKRAYFRDIVVQNRPWMLHDRENERLKVRITSFEIAPGEEQLARQRAEALRQQILSDPNLEWGFERVQVRGQFYDELQRALASLKPGQVSPVVRAAKWFFIIKLIGPPKPQQFVIESVRTLTNGQPEAVIAFPTGIEELPLLTITFPFVQLVERLGPPAMSYAVIDDAGTVLFHSDSERNGIENVFTETDPNRQLRAAVIAHHEEFIDAKYWGEDQRILVTPLQDMPWTLLTFRNKRLLRTMNLETLVVSLLLFLMSLGIPLALVVGIMLARPSYRARWAWPLQSRYSDWRDLLRYYAVTLLAFVICAYTFAPLPRLIIGFALPVQALIGTYLLLDRTPKRLAHGLAVAAWTLLTVGLFAGIIAADMYGQVLPFTAPSWLVRAVLFVLAATAVHAVVVRHAPASVPWRKFARTYTACGVLIVLLMAVLPMMAFFQTAVGNEVEALVKYGQLDLANRLLRRMEALTEKSWRKDGNMSLWYHMPFFFESTWCVQTDWFSNVPGTFGHLRQPCDRTSTARGGSEFHPTQPFVPAVNDVGERIETILPQYSDHTIAMRDLHHGAAGDQSWYTLRAGRVLALFRRLDLNDVARGALADDFDALAEMRAAEHVEQVLRSRGVPAAAANASALQAVDAAKLATDAPKRGSAEDEARRYLDYAEHQVERLRSGGQWLVIVSRMPPLLPTAFAAPDPIEPFPRGEADLLTGVNEQRASFPGPPPDAPWPAPLRRVPFALTLLAALGGLLWSIRFIARRIFLYDLREPDWLRAVPLRPPFSDHLFVISAEEKVEKLIDVGDCCRIRFREYSRAGARADVLDHVGRAGASTHVVLEDFGYRIEDAQFTKWKFDLLGSLVQLGDRTIIVVSPVPPTLLLTAMPDVEDALLDRWLGILRSFVWIDSARNLAPPAIAAPATTPAPARRVRGLLLGRLRDLDQALDRRIRAVGYWLRQFTARGRQRRDRADDLRWLRRETRASALLRQFRSQLQDMEGGREQMIDELCERTDKYYQALWQMCSAQERVVLFHIAQYGVANATNRRVLRRLLTRGLLTREPELRLFNDTFRLFVCNREEDVRKQREIDPAGVTTWDQLRIPLFIALLVVAGVFLGTQKELANATSAIVTALATGLPVIVKLIGTFTDRRLAAAQR
jgi:hypothetical protein